jgi:PKD repeat protein
MKMLRGLLLVFSFTTAFNLGAQNCTGDFTWWASGNTINFLGTTTPNITSVIWDFGDGNFDYTNTLFPNHAYSAAGNYTVCIECFDSINNCSDSTCHVINVNPCYASFTYTLSGNTVHFTGYANGGSANSVYQWNFGYNNATSTQQNPSYTYPGPGVYNVCFAYYDTTTSCSDSLCAQITINSCNADFTFIDSVGYVFFINTSSLGNNGVYYWDFGDGNNSTQTNPSHSYNAVGTYLVCLTAYDSLQNFCDSTCHYITITNVVGTNEMKNDELSFAVTPNPSDENCNLSFDLLQPTEITFTVFDSYGRMVREIKKENFAAGKQTVNINTNDFSSGVYFIKANVNGQLMNTKMIVTHKQ